MNGLIAYLRGCDSTCVEQFKAIMDYTGWSQNTVYIIFFTGIFFLLLVIVAILYRFRPKRFRYRNRVRKNRR